MNRTNRRAWIAGTCIALGAIVATPAWADPYSDTVNIFRKAQQSSKFFNTAYGYAVFPTIGKGGVGIGGAHGNGRVYQQGKYIGDTSMTQLSVGFQLGGQAYSQMIFFENAAALQKFTSGQFEFSADASAVAITAGASAKAGTTGATAGASLEKNTASVAGAYTNGMAVFTVAKGGLMYEAAIAGQKYSFNRKS
jgi:lipid-binding SYLF domain-containing protein